MTSYLLTRATDGTSEAASPVGQSSGELQTLRPRYMRVGGHFTLFQPTGDATTFPSFRKHIGRWATSGYLSGLQPRQIIQFGTNLSAGKTGSDTLDSKESNDLVSLTWFGLVVKFEAIAIECVWR